MTGYQSKKAAASAKTIDEVNWADHEPDGRRAAAQGKLDSMEREALKQALEALEHCCFSDALVTDKDVAADAILAIREALAQPEQRTWVDLPDDVMWSADYGGSKIINLIYAKAIQSKLKERNA